MKRLCARWVPRLLKEHEMSGRVRESERFLKRCRKEGDAFLKRIITVDETWVYHFDPESKMQSSRWKHTYSPPLKRLFFDMEGVVLCHAAPENQSINAVYYSKVIIG